MMNRRMFLAAAAAAAPAAVLLNRPVAAAEPAVFADGGIALRGTDPVAYFTDNMPIAGSAEHALMWNGTTWHFASADNMEAFMADPEAYAPQYGGYCAFAMASGYIAPTVPEAWTIHEGKLYLNFSTSVRSRWERDIPGNVAKADANWPAALG